MSNYVIGSGGGLGVLIIVCMIPLYFIISIMLDRLNENCDYTIFDIMDGKVKSK